jgi:TRAP-type mannitol/chloroaromatic compound transport system substrate-binding protein
MEAAWSESDAYLREQAAANADFKKIYDSWSEFRAYSFPYLAGNESVYEQFAFSKP